jgi:hypothetical protein
MATIEIRFEGRTSDVSRLMFELFKSDKFPSPGAIVEIPEVGQLTLLPSKPSPPTEGLGAPHGLLEVALTVGDKVILPLFLAWLYDKLKAEKKVAPVTIVVANNYLQMDNDDETKKAILEALLVDEDDSKAASVFQRQPKKGPSGSAQTRFGELSRGGRRRLSRGGGDRPGRSSVRLTLFSARGRGPCTGRGRCSRIRRRSCRCGGVCRRD